jgi:hypothetical protein
LTCHTVSTINLSPASETRARDVRSVFPCQCPALTAQVQTAKTHSYTALPANTRLYNV